MKSPFAKNENQIDFLDFFLNHFFFLIMFFIFSTTKLGIKKNVNSTNFTNFLENISKFSMSQNF